MTLYAIAFNNLVRRKAKILLIICGLVVGIAAVVSVNMIVEAMRLDLGDQIDEFGSNVIIVPRAEGMEISYGGTHVSDVSIELEQLTIDDLEKIYEIPDADSINIVSPKMVTAVKANEKDALLVGVDPQKEFIMKSWFELREQAGLEPGVRPSDLALLALPADGLLLGFDAARALGVKTGERVTISGSIFRVEGILGAMGSVEDGLIYGNLLTVQELLGRPGEISMVEIAAYCNACPVEEIAAQLTEVLPNGRVTALRQAALLREETIDRFSAFSSVISGVILFIAGLLLFTTMMSSVHERTREIGIFRAIGFRGSHVMKIIFLEAGAIGFLGGISGYLLGSAAARVAGSYLAGINNDIPYQFSLFLPAVVLSVLISIAASAYPANKGAKLDPVEALRFI